MKNRFIEKAKIASFEKAKMFFYDKFFAEDAERYEQEIERLREKIDYLNAQSQMSYYMGYNDGYNGAKNDKRDKDTQNIIEEILRF